MRLRDRFLRSASNLGIMTTPTSYDNWTREELIARLVKLDRSHSHLQAAKITKNKPFDFSLHPTRKIALKFCYSGWAYNGLAFQMSPTPLPTVEDTLFKALAHTKLIDPEAGFEGCGWERCGRTDRGVSAGGQVVSLWVRSTIGKAAAQAENQETPAPVVVQKPEIRYISVLNRVLPPTIRVYAWSPVLPSFSARFACRYRHYKYFFTSDGLDVSRMREGAARLLGEHDFRNLCKLDPTKQITNFKRTILRAEISPVAQTHGMYVFDLVGTAFLYHQVRHIMSILFLVGTGLEQPSVVSSLLNVNRDEPSAELEIVDCKPEYQMADGLSLMLWDCAYADTDVDWRTDDGMEKDSASIAGSGADLHHQLTSIHTNSLIHATLEAQFLSAVEKHHSAPPPYFPLSLTGLTASTRSDCQSAMNVPLGGGTFKRTAKYVPLLRRKRLESVEATNERWLAKKRENKNAEVNRDEDSDSI